MSRQMLVLASVLAFAGAGLVGGAGAKRPRVSVVIGSLSPAEGGPRTATPSPLRAPFGIDFDRTGAMTMVELAGGRVHRLDPAGRLLTIAGNGTKGHGGDGGPARKATFDGMHNVAV